MQILEFPKKNPQPPLSGGQKCILALGAESAGNFSVLKSPHNKGVRLPDGHDWEINTPLSRSAAGAGEGRGVRGELFFSENFGDLLLEKNYKKFQKSVLDFLKKNKLKPDIILTDLHPEYKTTLWGAKLAKKYNAKHIQIQHHLAHIFSAIGEEMLSHNSQPITRNSIIGIALDGTGYGLDEKIWGGEIFKITPFSKGGGGGFFGVERIGHLENQTMIGADLAIREPARMLISILSKFQKKDEIYKYVKRYYTKNQFELLYNQLQNNFNCVETSSTGRVLDAVSILLGFCGNKRNYKHEPIDLLEKNSTVPYTNLKPKIKKNTDKNLPVTSYQLLTTPLFEYLIKNLHKDKKRLAATAQLYIAQGLYKIIKLQATSYKLQAKFLAGGIGNNKIISNYLESRGFSANKKIPRGDGGISIGQIVYFAITDAID
jgi:hydrogenase maturation protein HypF